MGMAYTEMMEAGIDKYTSKLISLGVGTVNGLLEFIQLDDLVKGAKVLSAVDAGSTITKKLVKILKDQGVHIATETAQEVAQETVTIAGTNLGKAIENKPLGSAEEIGTRLKDTAVQSALTFGVLNIPGLSNKLANTVISRESLNNLSQQESFAVDEKITDIYSEALKQEGISKEGAKNYVDQTSANRTSKQSADDHAVEAIPELLQTLKSIQEKKEAENTSKINQQETKTETNKNRNKQSS